MPILYFDCFSGISGDMALGALLDCGVPLDELRAGLASLPVSGWDIQAQPVLVSGIHATDITITLHGVSDAQELAATKQKSHGHHHGHEHHHDVEHSHHEHSHGRSMAEIRDLISGSQLSERVKSTSLAIFEKIAAAEAYMHHKTIDEVHFHEIGGLDSLLDICGVAWCLEYLGIDAVYCSALPYSTGYVDCAHGRMPVPAPATLEILKGVPMVPTDIVGEMVTPTGAAIVATLAQGFGPPPPHTPTRIGIGSGKKRFPDRPNLLRAIVGEAATSTIDGLQQETLTLAECNIDDMNPEFYGAVMEKLFAAGALDVWLQPVQMKKNRPGTVLGVLCELGQRDAIVTLLLTETTSLGVRLSEVQRLSLPRRHEEVATPYGPVRLKVAEWPQQGLRRAMPEYEDVARLAREKQVPLPEVYAAALTALKLKS